MLNLGLPYCVLPYKLRTSKLALSHLHIKAKANFGSDLAIWVFWHLNLHFSLKMIQPNKFKWSLDFEFIILQSILGAIIG